jgi:hypothetical protein
VTLALPVPTAPRPVHVHRELHDALAWFKETWETTLDRVGRLHEGWSTVEPGDRWGTPAWTDRFRRFIVEGAETYDPVRMAWARMRFGGGLTDRAGGVFLFILACRDLDVAAAGLAMGGHCLCKPVHVRTCRCEDPARRGHQHGPCPNPSQPLFEEYAAWFAERAIDRLRWYLEHEPEPRPLDRPAWMERIGFTTREQPVADG